MNIGDKFYKYLGMGKFSSYTIYGIIKRHAATLYETECNSCMHGDNCRVLITKDSKGNYVFASMLSDDEESHYIWHKDDNNFYLNQEDCLISTIKNAIQNNKLDLLKENKRHEDNVKYIEQEIRKFEENLAVVNLRLATVQA